MGRPDNYFLDSDLNTLQLVVHKDHEQLAALRYARRWALLSVLVCQDGYHLALMHVTLELRIHAYCSINALNLHIVVSWLGGWVCVAWPFGARTAQRVGAW